MSASSAPVHAANLPSPPRRCRASPSPAPHCGRQRGEVVIERIREGGGFVQYPMLTRTNYQEWVLLTRVNMQAQGISNAVEPEEGDVVADPPKLNQLKCANYHLNE